MYTECRFGQSIILFTQLAVRTTWLSDAKTDFFYLWEVVDNANDLVDRKLRYYLLAQSDFRHSNWFLNF